MTFSCIYTVQGSKESLHRVHNIETLLVMLLNALSSIPKYHTTCNEYFMLLMDLLRDTSYDLTSIKRIDVDSIGNNVVQTLLNHRTIESTVETEDLLLQGLLKVTTVLLTREDCKASMRRHIFRYNMHIFYSLMIELL